MLHLLWELEWEIEREDVFSRREREREALWDGYVSVGIDFTTDSRPVPVPSRPPREFPSRFYPCKALIC